MRCVYFLVCVVYDLPLAQLHADHGNPTKLKGLNSKSKLHGVADENWPTSRSFYTADVDHFLAEKNASLDGWRGKSLTHS